MQEFFFQKVSSSSFLAASRPDLASVMTPHNSKMKSSVKPKASRSELSMASAKSIVFVQVLANSQIWEAEHKMQIFKIVTYVYFLLRLNFYHAEYFGYF